jgi:hypothetical protein
VILRSCRGCIVCFSIEEATAVCLEVLGRLGLGKPLMGINNLLTSITVSIAFGFLFSI